MHARVNYRQIPLGKMDEVVRTYQELTGPDRKAQHGFDSGLVLTNRQTGKLIAISFWKSEADMIAANPPGYADAVAGGPPEREEYEVSVHDPVTSADEGVQYARVAYRQARPGELEQVLKVYRDSVIADRRGQPGYQGGYVLTNKSTDRLITLGVWRSEAELAGSRHPDEVGKFTVGPPVRENYQVTSRV